jgi:hypothetical protein
MERSVEKINEGMINHAREIADEKGAMVVWDLLLWV